MKISMLFRTGNGNIKAKLLWEGQSTSVSLDLTDYDYVIIQMGDSDGSYNQKYTTLLKNNSHIIEDFGVGYGGYIRENNFNIRYFYKCTNEGVILVNNAVVSPAIRKIWGIKKIELD